MLMLMSQRVKINIVSTEVHTTTNMSYADQTACVQARLSRSSWKRTVNVMWRKPNCDLSLLHCTYNSLDLDLCCATQIPWEPSCVDESNGNEPQKEVENIKRIGHTGSVHLIVQKAQAQMHRLRGGGGVSNKKLIECLQYVWWVLSRDEIICNIYTMLIKSCSALSNDGVSILVRIPNAIPATATAVALRLTFSKTRSQRCTNPTLFECTWIINRLYFK